MCNFLNVVFIMFWKANVTHMKVIISVKSAKFRFMRAEWPAEIKKCFIKSEQWAIKAVEITVAWNIFSNVIKYLERKWLRYLLLFVFVLLPNQWRYSLYFLKSTNWFPTGVEALDVGLQDQIWILTGTFGGAAILLALTLLILILKISRWALRSDEEITTGPDFWFIE